MWTVCFRSALSSVGGTRTATQALYLVKARYAPEAITSSSWHPLTGFQLLRVPMARVVGPPVQQVAVPQSASDCSQTRLSGSVGIGNNSVVREDGELKT